MAWSGLWVRRLARNWRRPLRPMASPFPAGMEALMTDANLQLFACAAQQFGLVDDGNAERARLLQFGPGIRPHHHGRRFLGNVVGDVAARGLDQLLRLGPRQRRAGARDEVGLSRQRASPY